MAREDKKPLDVAETKTGLNAEPATGNGPEETGEKSRAFWNNQNRALDSLRKHHTRWADKRRTARDGNREQSWKRVTFSLPRSEAQEAAREFLRKYPKAAYWSEVESWRELPDDVIEFTMRRLPTAD